MTRSGGVIVDQHSTVVLTRATGENNECSASGCQHTVRPHPRVAFVFRLHMIVPCRPSTLTTKSSELVMRRMARRLVAGSIGAALVATPVASNLPVRRRRRRRPRFWLPLQGKPPRPQYRPPFHSFDAHAHGSATMPCACMYRCSETMWRLFLRAACTFRNRAVSVIARR